MDRPLKKAKVATRTAAAWQHYRNFLDTGALDELQELTQNQNLKHSESSLSKELYEELHQVEKNKFSIDSVKEFGAKVMNLQNLSAFTTIYPFIKTPLDLLFKSYGISINLP